MVDRRQEKRLHLLMWAALVFSMNKAPRELRERLSWYCLLEWAEIGMRKGD